MRDTIRQFQMRANAAPRQIWNYDDVQVNGNGGFMNSYQQKANAAPRQIWGYDDVRTPHDPMRADMHRYQGRVDDMHPAMVAADDLRLGKLQGLYGRRSGSTLRTFRSKFGDALPDTTTPIRVLSGTEDESWFTWTNIAIVAAAGLVGYGIYRVVK